MKIPLPFDFEENPRTFMRRAGYAEQSGDVVSYVKRLRGDSYPRFHVYLEQDRDNRWNVSLHLDQKKPSYAGAHAHNGEYEGGQVDIEGSRLEGLIKNQMDNQAQGNQSDQTSQQSSGFFSKLFR